MDSKIDRLSKWIKNAVQGGDSAPLSTYVPKKPDFKEPKFKEPQKQAPVHKGVMRIIPIGGLEEVGKNSMLVEHEDEILAIDMGFQFPESDMLGIDYIIPDIQYLKERKNRIKGIIITHGHLDHIGAIPFVIADLGFPPIYGGKLSLGLIKAMLDEHKLTKLVKLIEIDNQTKYRLGRFFEIDFFRVNHSIPDAYGLHIKTPNGSMVHTGDFKFDFTPADGVASDIAKISRIGKQGVTALFSDSTNATKPGHTISEKVVGNNLNKSIENAEGRIIIASFSSLIGRIQQILDFAASHGRIVFLSGRSMEKNAEIAHTLGFLKSRKDLIRPIKEVKNFPADKILILTTGSQGEPMSALSRMAGGAHTHVKIVKGDVVVVSSSPIPGNEKQVAFLIDQLSRLGARIVHNKIMDVHTSGHGQQEDLKMMMALVRPQHLIPVHGNHYMRDAHGKLGPQVGIPEPNVHMLDNGSVLEIRAGKLTFTKEDIKVNYVVVDGLSMGEAGSQVLQERESMAQNGEITVMLNMRKGGILGFPIISAHGFAYQKETGKILKEIEKEIKSAVERLKKKSPNAKARDVENYIKSAISMYVLKKMDKRPLVTVIIINV
jgi:ribonuclease J